MTATSWQWAVAVTTAPRPLPTLERTLQSLEAAGFAAPRVVVDTTGAGSWPTWLAALGQLVAGQPEATAYLVVQDDVVFCRDLRWYLEQTLWPSPKTALCSPFCPGAYRREAAGWHREDQGWNLVAAQCWAIPPGAARRMLADLASIVSRSRVDAIVGRWAKEVGLECWYHTPSLAQHTGLKNSALGDNLVTCLREAHDFVGENYSTDAIPLRDKYTPWTIGPTLAYHLKSLLRPGMRTLECGSGLSTRLFVEAGCDHLALEHDRRFAAPLPQIHLCGLTGKPPWYDWRPMAPFDLVLVDGPPAACGGRSGILRHVHQLAHPGTIFVCDDTDRPDDAAVADTIARRLDLAQKVIAPVLPADFSRQGRILAPPQRLQESTS
jgi:hypothetical protein